MAAATSLESAIQETQLRLAISIGLSLIFGLLSLLFAFTVVAQSHTMAYVDETTGRERVVACGSMLAPAAVPDDVPLMYVRSCADSTVSILQAGAFAVVGGVLISNSLRSVRRWRQV